MPWYKSHLFIQTFGTFVEYAAVNDSKEKWFWKNKFVMDDSFDIKKSRSARF
jgi:hypothetical protein